MCTIADSFGIWDKDTTFILFRNFFTVKNSHIFIIFSFLCYFAALRRAVNTIQCFNNKDFAANRALSLDFNSLIWYVFYF